MSDPPTTEAETPKGKAPTTNAPASSRGTRAGSPPDVQSSTVLAQLAGYRKTQAQPSTTPEPTAPARGPRVQFRQLAGIDGLHARDAFEGYDPTWGDWVACMVVGPDGKEIGTALTNAETEAGRALHAAMRRGLFDDPTELVSISVTQRPSNRLDPETGKPFTRTLVAFD